MAEAAVLKQVEFYFSDSNLPRDKFLRELTAKDNGWVSIATLASFKRMQTITKDPTIVVAALKQSKNLLEVNEEGTKVRRKTELPQPEAADTINARTIYAKGFPASMKQEDLENWWAMKGQVNAVRMRRLRDKSFKGSVFVEFQTPEEAQKVVKSKLAAPAENGEAKEDTFLSLEMRNDYMNRKEKEVAAKKALKNVGKADEGKAAAAAPEAPREFVRDLLVKFSGLGQGATREILKEVVEKAGGAVTYVDFTQNLTEGTVRLKEDSALKASAVVAKFHEEKTEVVGSVPQTVALSGAEEDEYMKAVFTRQADAKNKRKAPSRGKGGKGGKGGGKGGNKRRKKGGDDE